MNRLLASISPLLLAIVSSGCDATRRPEPVEAKKPGPVENKKPKRPPEFFGVIEKVERRSIGNSPEFDTVLMKGLPPLHGFPKPLFPPGAIGYRDQLWLNLPNARVEQHSGPFAAGQYVWVWHAHREFIATPIEQIYPEYVITEAVLPKLDADGD